MPALLIASSAAAARLVVHLPYVRRSAKGGGERRVRQMLEHEPKLGEEVARGAADP